MNFQNEDVIATLQAQRNEAWDAAARAGAACAAAARRIDEIEKELEVAKRPTPLDSRVIYLQRTPVNELPWGVFDAIDPDAALSYHRTLETALAAKAKIEAGQPTVDDK